MVCSRRRCFPFVGACFIRARFFFLPQTCCNYLKCSLLSKISCCTECNAQEKKLHVIFTLAHAGRAKARTITLQPYTSRVCHHRQNAQDDKIIEDFYLTDPHARYLPPPPAPTRWIAPMASSIDLKELVYLRGKRKGNAGMQQQLLSQNQQSAGWW